MEFSSEKITLFHSEITTFNFLEHPHGGFLISYLPENSSNIVMMQQDQRYSEWSHEIPQNKSNFQQLTEKWNRIEGFSSCFDNKGDLLRFFNVKTNEGQVKLYSTASYSYGKHWDSLKEMTDEFQSWKIVTQPLKIKTGINIGQIVLSIEDPRVKRAMTVFTKDNGRSWNFSLFVEPPEIEEEPENFHKNGTLSPVTIELKNNQLKMYCRTLDPSRLTESMSFDMGSTWTTPVSTSVPDFSKKDAFTAYCVPNIEGTQKNILILGATGRENQLTPTLWYSKDEGKTFEVVWKSHSLESNPIKHSIIYLDKEKIIHWLFVISDNRIYHYWTLLSSI
ncbi:exo-alpha-sialidase [Candidatus Lokiarchaeum ossiferum]|uniref:exo-alpha-sialidase n=1 Tax=Candidatus Lokiarchaeum ossiferum TaxID=2951803 RepID=UPI00352E15CE